MKNKRQTSTRNVGLRETRFLNDRSDSILIYFLIILPVFLKCLKTSLGMPDWKIMICSKVWE